MKILKIDHLGIAVNSIEEGKSFWSDVLGLAFEGAETVEAQKVTTAFFPVGESEVELLESTAPDGPVAKYIEKKGQGIQHVAFRVENIEAALAELKEKGGPPDRRNAAHRCRRRQNRLFAPQGHQRRFGGALPAGRITLYGSVKNPKSALRESFVIAACLQVRPHSSGCASLDFGLFSKPSATFYESIKRSHDNASA